MQQGKFACHSAASCWLSGFRVFVPAVMGLIRFVISSEPGAVVFADLKPN